jgi:hypothetical protein
MATVSVIALSLAAGAATAQNDGKNPANSLGTALEGMGKELNKASGSSAKKDTKTSAKKKEQASTSDNAKKK